MRTHSGIAGFSAIAVVAKDLKVSREIIPNDKRKESTRSSMSAAAGASAKLRAVIVDMVNR